MFDFIIYNANRYFTEMQKWLIDTFTFTNGEKDDRYMVISGEDDDDIWFLE